MTLATPIGGNAAPELVIPPNARQRRWTVLMRGILLIPLAIWAALVGIAAFFAVIGGWLGALFLGRLPSGLADFLEGYVNLSVRLSAYGNLLTDQYPTFALRGGSEGEFRLIIARTPLNRFAVLFRIFLAIPAYIVASLVTSGYFVFAIASWLITLVAGRLPDTLRNAGAAVLRYNARFYAWFSLLTATYPTGLFGDPEMIVEAPWPSPTGTAFGADEQPMQTPNVRAPDRISADPDSPTSQLVLTTGAKAIVVISILFGLAGDIGSSVASGHNNATTANIRTSPAPDHGAIAPASARRDQ